jgi:hypothetical protein
MTHRHHIIPRHAGGSDDPSNIVELTVEDRLAWMGLLGIIDKEEIIRQLAADRSKRVHTGRKRSSETIQHMKANHKGTRGWRATKEQRQARSVRMKGKAPNNKGKKSGPRKPEHIEASRQGNLGQRRSPEAKLKMSIKKKQYWANRKAAAEASV